MADDENPLNPAQSVLPSHEHDPEFERAREDARAWAVRLQSGRATAHDVEAFKRWRARSPLHAKAWAWTAEDWARLGPLMETFGRHYPERVAPPTPRRQGRRLFLGAAASAFGGLAVAAVVRPPLGLWPSWSELGADYRTATGEQRNLQLGERVQVALNTQTSISVAEQADVSQIALIAGEAAISSHGRRCEVSAEGASTRLADAEVEIRRLSSGLVRVRCLRGEAELRHADAVVPVRAGLQIQYGRDAVLPVQAMPDVAEGWRAGMVVFDDLPLSEVVEEINRYRPGRVVLTNRAAGARRFSAKFEIGRLDDAIALLEVAYGV